MKRIVRHIIAGLAVVLLVAAAFLWWVLGTNSGARWTIDLISRYSGLSVQTKSIDGHFCGELRLEQLSIAWPKGRAEAREFKLHWQPLTLLIGQFGFMELSVAGARIRDDRPEKRPGAPRFTWPAISGQISPLPVRIRALRLTDVTYRRLDRAPVRIDHAEARVRFSQGRVSLTNIELKMPQFRASGAVIAGFDRPSLRTEISIIPANSVVGIDEVRITADLGPAKVPFQLKGPVWTAAYAGSKKLIEADAETALTDISFSLRKMRAKQAGREGSVTGQAEFLFAAERPGFKARLYLNDLDVSKEVSFLDTVSGSVLITGNKDAYKGSFFLVHEGPGWKTGRISADFRGAASSVGLTSIRGSLLNGTIEGSGSVDWKKIISVSASLKARGMDPSLVLDKWKGSVNMDMDAAVRLRMKKEPEASLSLRLLDSRVLGEPVSGRIKASMKEGMIEIGRLELNGKGFDIRADGELSRRIDFDINMADLSLFKPEAGGRAGIKGWIRKAKQSFSGSITAEMRDFSLNEIRAASVSLSGRIEDLHDLPFSLNISVRDGSYKLLHVDSLSASASGTLTNHVVRASMQSSSYSITFRMTGAYNEDGWRGNVIHFYGSDDRGIWRATKPADIVVAGGNISLFPLVLSGTENERIELYGTIARKPLSGSFSIDCRDLNLSRANAWVTGLKLAGYMNGRVTGRINPGGELDVAADASLSEARITRNIQELELKFELRKAELAAAWRGKAIEGKASLVFAEYGQIEIGLLVPVPARLPAGVDRNGPLRVEITGTVREMGILSFIFPGMAQKTRGRLDLDVRANGTWNSPRFEGSLRLDEAGGYFPAAGITVTDIQLEARIEQNIIIIGAFSARSGQGKVSGNATVTLEGLRPVQYEGSLRGERFQALLLPQVRMQVNPDIRFKGTPRKLSVDGEIILPELLIYGAPREAQPIQPSGDVLIIGAREEKESVLIETDINLRIILGDRVIVKARGIDAQLQGQVTLTGGSPGELTGKGEITATRGRYSIYGVNLDIARGRLLFAGGPADNPSLDILALRAINDVKAGVAVSGTLRKPGVKLYSEPAMPDTDILAYVLLGHPLGQDKEQGDLLIRAAAALLSAGQSVALQDQIKNRLGVDIIDIEAGKGEESRSLVTIGKYLSSRLYVSYGYALFSGESLFKMRYRFGKRWELESRSGETSGVDLYYTIQFY